MTALDLLAQAEPAAEILLETFVCQRTQRQLDVRRVLRSLRVEQAQLWRRLILQSVAEGHRILICRQVHTYLHEIFGVEQQVKGAVSPMTPRAVLSSQALQSYYV